MSRNEQRLPDYLGHILGAIERIARYTRGMDEAAFLGNEMAQDAVIRNFEIIGEASRNIERRHPEFVVKHPELTLGDAYRFRNAMAHGYFTVDLGIVWKTATTDLPEMKTRIESATQDLHESQEQVGHIRPGESSFNGNSGNA